ncbi:MAG: tyrosine-type recombinase/integrase [Shewanella sp.]
MILSFAVKSQTYNQDGKIHMPRPRDRFTGIGLLPYMQARPNKDGSVTYRLLVLGKYINLGRDKNAAIQRAAETLGLSGDEGTLGQFWREYRASAAFTSLSESSQKDYDKCWRHIEPVLGHCSATALRTPDFARYVHDERADHPTRANHERAVLVNIYQQAIRAGRAEHNPVKPVPPHRLKPNARNVVQSELAPFVAWLYQQDGARKMMALMAEFAALCGNRAVEVRTLTWPQISADAVRVRRAKQRDREIFDLVEMSPSLAQLIQKLRELPRAQDCLYVFANRDGNPYTEGSFSALWQRVMNQAMAAGVVKQRFTFHNLRAHYATQHKASLGSLPDLHQNPAITARIYDRNLEVKRRAL